MFFVRTPYNLDPGSFWGIEHPANRPELWVPIVNADLVSPIVLFFFVLKVTQPNAANAKLIRFMS